MERQEVDCRLLAVERGWQVLEPAYVDDDRSAYRTGARRENYERLLEDIEARLVDVVAVWHTDRLHRSPRELEDVIDLADETGVTIHSVKAGHIDLSTPAGRAVARTLVAWARYESEHKAERIQRKHQELAEAGKPSGSMLSYGFNADGTINEVQAEVIRELAQRALDGESLRSMVRSLTESGVPTQRGGTWRSGTLRQILTAARLSGQREWTPRSTGTRGYGMGEIVAKGTWDAIISPEQTEALRRLFGDEERRTSRPAEHLLSGGILRCGRCGGSMNSHADKKSGRTYACIKTPGSSKCGGISVRAEPVDELVVTYLFDRLDGLDLAAGEPPEDVPTEEVREAIRADRERLIDLGNEKDDGLIGRAEYERRRTRIEDRVATNVTRLTSRSTSNVLTLVPKDRAGIEAAWADWVLDQRRRVLGAVMERVVVHPATRRGYPKFDPSRVEPVYRV